MEGAYSARQASARRAQSPSTPLSEPRRRASAATPLRQSTQVPKTSKVSAWTPLKSANRPSTLSAPECAVVLREVMLNHRKLEGGEDSARRQIGRAHV